MPAYLTLRGESSRGAANERGYVYGVMSDHRGVEAAVVGESSGGGA